MNINSVVELKANPNIPELTPGDTVRVKTKVVEGDKTRTQAYQGVVIKVKEGEVGSSFTVRRVAYGVGVERTFPYYSPVVESVEVLRHGKVRRARLFYLRGLSTKASRIKEKRIEKGLLPEQTEEQPADQQPVAEQAPVAEQQLPAEVQSQATAPEQIRPTAQAPEPPKEQAPAPATEQPEGKGQV